MPGRNVNLERLLELARRGDRAARDQLLGLHRTRLRKMIAVRLDPRLAVRVDPSDVVQDTLLEAGRRLSEFLRQHTIPFYPWLRNLAAQQLVDLQRRHIIAKRRSVDREEQGIPGLSSAGAGKLADCVMSALPSPLSRMQKAELMERVRGALDELPKQAREVLVLRYLEQLSIAETAAVLGVNKAVVKMRHLRALQRLRELLDDPTAVD